MVEDQSANSLTRSTLVTLRKEDRWLLKISADVPKQDVVKRRFGWSQGLLQLQLVLSVDDGWSFSQLSGGTLGCQLVGLGSIPACSCGPDVGQLFKSCSPHCSVGFLCVRHFNFYERRWNLLAILSAFGGFHQKESFGVWAVWPLYLTSEPLIKLLS